MPTRVVDCTGLRNPLGRQALQALGDKRPGAWSCIQKAFGKQPLEYVESGLARYAKLHRQIARGWQLRAPAEPPFDDARSKLAINLSGEVVAPDDRDMDVHSAGYLRFPEQGYFCGPWSGLSLLRRASFEGLLEEEGATQSSPDFYQGGPDRKKAKLVVESLLRSRFRSRSAGLRYQRFNKYGKPD